MVSIAKVTLEISKVTIAMIAVSLFVGFLIGNVFRIGGPVGVSVTGPAVSPQPSQPTSPTRQTGGTVQFDNPFDDDPVMGDKNAKVVVIEFSDFQCPFCRRFYVQTLTQLDNDYVKTGKVAFVYRDFPLDSIHEGATPYALAAECADDQGKWREMHNKIFDEQNKEGAGTVPYVGDATVKKWATEIALNAAQFNECFDSKKYQSEVQKDFQDGVNAGVGGTPTFFIGNKEKGFQAVVGAQPYSALKQVIDSYLS